MLRFVVRVFVILVAVAVSASAAFAQSLGTFPFQLAPYCNTVTLNVTQMGNTLTLDGYDDQCSGEFRGSVVGTAFPNPNGSIGIGLSLVSTPGATPVHIAVTFNLQKLRGPWQDTAGHVGTFVLNPSMPAAGSPLPGTGGIIGGNTAVGGGALIGNTTGTFNTAVGWSTLFNNAAGNSNTGVGAFALVNSTAGHQNTAIGADTLPALASGNKNIALGDGAGRIITSGSNNIYVGSGAGAAVENSTIRIGEAASHGATFIAGIIAQSVDDMSDRPVLIDATGKLGTIASSARFKQDIRPLDDMSSALLRLEPVSFRYRPDQHRGGSLQYGLIAEQVAEVIPELVIRDEEGRPLTVKYHILPTLLLAQIQRLERERAAQATTIATQANDIRELRDRLDSLERERR